MSLANRQCMVRYGSGIGDKAMIGTHQMNWPSWLSRWLKRPNRAELFDKAMNEFAEKSLRYRALARGGWKLAQYEPPIGLGDVMFTRDGEETWVACWEHFHPAQNVAGLWWRPLRDSIDVTPLPSHME